jgi:hypothetical protein
MSEAASRVANVWAATETRHLADPEQGAQLEIDDPRNRTVESTLADLAGDPKALT